MPRAERLRISAEGVEFEIRDQVQSAAGRGDPTGRGAHQGRVHVVDPLHDRAGRNVEREAGDEPALIHVPDLIAVDAEVFEHLCGDAGAVLAGGDHRPGRRLLLDCTRAGPEDVIKQRDDLPRVTVGRAAGGAGLA